MPFSETFIKTLNDFKRMCIQMEKELIKLQNYSPHPVSV